MSSILSRPDRGTQVYSVSSPSDESLLVGGYSAYVIYSSRDQSLLPFRYHMLTLAEFSSWKVHDDRGRGVNLCLTTPSKQCASIIPRNAILKLRHLGQFIPRYHNA
jgi:hypothetical protein